MKIFTLRGITAISAQIFLIILLTTLTPVEMSALPSYARQTGMACNTCHITFPQLTPFGRSFKLGGYTLSTVESVDAKSDSGEYFLKLMKFLPFSAMVQTSYTHLTKPVPGTANDNVDFPQQLSIFLAGEITPKVGLFLQITYDDISGAFGWDNADIRYADNTTLFAKDFTWGATFNNSPSVQDLWHTTPAWSYPFATSPVAPAPGASALMSGTLAGRTLGLGLYGMWNNFIYLEGSIYTNAPQGGNHPPDTSAVNYIKGIAPYWRLVLQNAGEKSYLSVGTFGMMADILPAGVSGSASRYTDIGADVQYELPMGEDYLSAYLTYLYEKQDLSPQFTAGKVQNSTNNLSTIKATVSYFFARQLNLNLSYFSTTGSADTLLYGQSPLTGYSGGSPNSNGLIGEFAYIPWYNTRFALQYTYYNKFNGATSNYDAMGRNANDNNTFYIVGWIMF